ncbi:glutathione S-transferase [Tothia fuscella]|uniref:Glutathione S-transferase n=1 Tax=Tothia fuscella TaxID=1048955 RepID=A0A9P4NG57_9PEZI|nr:glutathione S-transferase [Tothia fuscella]
MSSATTATTPTPHLTIYRGFPDQGKYVWSPFVVKLEARLRFAGINNYKTEAGSLGKAPRGKIPYISLQKEDLSEPEWLADTSLIVQRFVDDGLLPDLNDALSTHDQALDLALRALLEDKLYFYQTLERWNDNYYSMRDKVMAAIPYPVRVAVGLLAHRGVMGTLHGQGTARYTPEERDKLRGQIWDSMNTLAAESKNKHAGGDAPFWLLGKEGPTEVDATLFGMIASGLVCVAAPDTQRHVRSHEVLMDYAQRIHDTYFPDYECWEP